MYGKSILLNIFPEQKPNPINKKQIEQTILIDAHDTDETKFTEIDKEPVSGTCFVGSKFHHFTHRSGCAYDVIFQLYVEAST
jgi:hypothetical protein